MKSHGNYLKDTLEYFTSIFLIYLNRTTLYHIHDTEDLMGTPQTILKGIYKIIVKLEVVCFMM